MQWIQPTIEVPGDRADRIMSRSGHIVGATKTRAVWCFGFLPFSDAAQAYGVSITWEGFGFLFVIADPNGKVLATYRGIAAQWPARFQHIVGGDFNQVE